MSVSLSVSVRTGGTATQLDESTRTETTEALSVRSVSISCAGANSSSLISVSSTEAVTVWDVTGKVQDSRLRGKCCGSLYGQVVCVRAAENVG